MFRTLPTVALLAGLFLLAGITCQGQNVLVDATRDGGVWWSPQSLPGPFNPANAHQGKALADYLKSRGMTVTELGYPDAITPALLASSNVVIAIGSCSSHPPAVLDAYEEWVSAGGRLVLLVDHLACSSALPSSLGLTFTGSVQGTITSFTAHPITNGTTSLNYMWGSYLTEYPAAATILASLPEGPVMGVMPYGAGTVFFMGDTNSIELVPQPLIDNLLAYMLGFQALESQIQHLGLNGGNTNALLAKLRAAQASIAAGNTSAAINQLRALTNQVRALLNAGKLTQAQADALNLAVETIVETLAP